MSIPAPAVVLIVCALLLTCFSSAFNVNELRGHGQGELIPRSAIELAPASLPDEFIESSVSVAATSGPSANTDERKDTSQFQEWHKMICGGKAGYKDMVTCKDAEVPSVPGLYEWAVGNDKDVDEVVYVGQTGSGDANLRKRCSQYMRASNLGDHRHENWNVVLTQPGQCMWLHWWEMERKTDVITPAYDMEQMCLLTYRYPFNYAAKTGFKDWVENKYQSPIHRWYKMMCGTGTGTFKTARECSSVFTDSKNRDTHGVYEWGVSSNPRARIPKYVVYIGKAEPGTLFNRCESYLDEKNVGGHQHENFLEALKAGMCFFYRFHPISGYHHKPYEMEQKFIPMYKYKWNKSPVSVDEEEEIRISTSQEEAEAEEIGNSQH